jgi:hypothetical protein
MKFAILEDDLIIFCCSISVKWVRIVAVLFEFLSKDPRKTRNEFLLVGKQELNFSRITSGMSKNCEKIKKRYERKNVKIYVIIKI